MTGFQHISSATEWQQAITSVPNGHALQSWAWAEFKSRWGWQTRPLVMHEPGSDKPLVAAMVLKRPLPRTPFSVLYVPKGPAFDYANESLRNLVLAELEQVAHQEQGIFIKIDPEVVKGCGAEEETAVPMGTQFTQDLQARGWRFSDDQIQFRNTVELDLTLSEEELLAAMKSKTRYNIGLAARKGITVREGTPDDFPALAEMYAETAVRDGFGIRPSGYYLDGWHSFHQAGMGHLLIAEYEAEPVAAVYLVKFGTKAIYMYGASSEKERNRMPNYLLQWEAVRWAKAQGCTIYDFWGAPDEFTESDRLWGVWRFKAGFNGEVVRHIGAWDYVARPFWYWMYATAVPKYLDVLRARKKQKL
ncbi:MAG: peptidoglycan bridge formation glycyltransferase FemA/FemB family protein [Anaerolineae bacterium]|nr:peptidoglycan bridge formation glycyltransferase FemA/FemB family protein [Anaerolineae bacterium]